MLRCKTVGGTEYLDTIFCGKRSTEAFGIIDIPCDISAAMEIQDVYKRQGWNVAVRKIN